MGKNDKKELTVEEQVAALAARVETVEEENTKLGEANAKLAEDNAALAKKVAKLKKTPSDKKEGKEEKKEKLQVPSDKFEVEGTSYKFKVAMFNLPGFGLLAAKDALKEQKVLARLVELKATGIIEEC